MSSFSDLLDHLIREAGIEGRELARQVPVNPGHVSNMRQGKKRASLQVAERLDEILGADGRLVAAALADGLPADRPAVLAAIGAVIDPSETAELARRLRASEVDAATLDALARTSETLCTQYAYRDPVQLRRETLQWISYIGRLLDGRTGLREHRELLVQAGWLTLLASCLEYDSGMASAAEASRVSALHLGREAGHAEIVAWSLEIAAWMAHTRHDPQAAVTYARAGQEAAPRASVTVQLIAHEARMVVSSRLRPVSGCHSCRFTPRNRTVRPLSRIWPSLTSTRRNPIRKRISPPALLSTAEYRWGRSSDQGSAAEIRCSALASAPAMPSSGTDTVAGWSVSTCRMPAPTPGS